MLRLFLFFPLFLLSQDLFLLPDESRNFLDTLNTHIKKANHEIYLFTPSIDEYTLLKTLKQRAEKNVKITIITSEPISEKNKAAYLSLFKNIHVFALSPLLHEIQNEGGLQGSLVCIDNKELFLLSEAVESENLKQNYAFALYQKRRCEQIFHTLIKRAKAY